MYGQRRLLTVSNKIANERLKAVVDYATFDFVLVMYIAKPGKIWISISDK